MTNKKSKENSMEDDMDDFAVELENNISKSMENKDIISPRFRELFCIFLSSVPKIDICDKVSDDGDVRFVVSKDDIGLSFEDIIKYRSEIFSGFCANFMGELLVRENIDRFAKVLVHFNKEPHSSAADRYIHRKFGMEVVRDKFIFVFHISLLQSILTENFKRQTKLKAK